MTEQEQAARRHTMWLGTYKRSGELKVTPVWCFLNHGNLEFLTSGDSYKAKRICRNPRVICHLGSKDGPVLEGNAEIGTDLRDIWRGYKVYRKTHPGVMLLLAWPIRNRIRSGRQVMVRVKPDEPNPLAGITEPVV